MPEKLANPIPTAEERPLLSARETFGPLNMTDTTGYALLAAGLFPVPVTRVGGRWMVRTVDLRAFLGLDATGPP